MAFLMELDSVVLREASMASSMDSRTGAMQVGGWELMKDGKLSAESSAAESVVRWGDDEVVLLGNEWVASKAAWKVQSWVS
jgi:hypothetical protein